MSEFVKKKKKTSKALDQLWQYRTEHVDTMLYQYALGLERLANSVGNSSVIVDTINRLVREHFEHMKTRFSVTPSFTINFLVDGSRIVLEKTPTPDE